MTKPSDIPQDVWDEADAVGEAIHGRHERGWVCWPLVSHAGRPAQEIVARAILDAKAEENEACAQVCIDYPYEWKDVGKRYAAAIRARTP